MGRRTIRRLGLLTPGILVLLVGCRQEISGAYLATSSDTVLCLQLVQAPDSRLTGQFNISALQPGGKINRRSIAITGAVDGENVTIMSNGLFGYQIGTLSGTAQGNTLTLTGTQPGPLIFRRASLNDYQAQLNALDQRSKAGRSRPMN